MVSNLFVRQVKDRVGDGHAILAGMAHVTVREVRAGEHGELARLTVQAYLAVPGIDLGADYLAHLADVEDRARDAVVLVAVDEDGRLLGGVTYVPGPGPWAEFSDPAEAGMRMLAVDPVAQGAGVGRLLVEACVTRARADGRARLTLHTTAAMPAARRLYERLGFRRDPARDWTVEPDLLLLGYVLDLGG
jgi:GNAT superfamily N-acetyltransferase